jgi:type I restriction enzyme R subunit
MKGRGTRLCEDINKRYFTIFDYSGASQLEDAEFDGHPANKQSGRQEDQQAKEGWRGTPKVLAEGVSVVISTTNRYVCLADGRKLPFEEYTEQSREFILDVSHKGLDELLRIWIDKSSRHELREALRDRDIYPSAFRHYLDLPDTDDVDILAKIGFQLPRVPTALIGPTGCGMKTRSGCLTRSAKRICPKNDASKPRFWQTALDHYRLFGIDDLEQARTYGAPQFAEQFGSFTTLYPLRRPGAAEVRPRTGQAHLYVPMAS